MNAHFPQLQPQHQFQGQVGTVESGLSLCLGICFLGSSEGLYQPFRFDPQVVPLPVTIARVLRAMPRDGVADVFRALNGPELVFQGVA